MAASILAARACTFGSTASESLSEGPFFSMAERILAADEGLLEGSVLYFSATILAAMIDSSEGLSEGSWVT